MLVFYSEAGGRSNVPAKAPKEESLEEVLAILQSLDTRRGFLGIPLRNSFVLQLLPSKKGIRVELLDKSRPSIDACDADIEFVEKLIRAAAGRLDVCQIARQTISKWDHMDLR
jgi:hypothetical protein